MKKTLKIIGISLVLLFLFRGLIYQQTIHYTPIKEKQTILLSNQKAIAAIKLAIKGKELDLPEITNISAKITYNSLTFTLQEATNNPNKVVETGKANCIGYAALFSAVANHIIQKAKLQDRYQVKHLVGKIHFLNVDLHQFFTNSFYQDHDYNIIEDKMTKTGILIDPSIDNYLYLGNKPIH